MSQFHYGSIKTKLYNILALPIACLNSTMVRLKLIRINNKREYDKSQFHYGSIKTKYEWFKNKETFTGLNSTMVRLKPLKMFNN